MSMAKKMDTNHDGMVSKEEFMKAMEERWNAMDTNKTGMVSVEQAARNMLFLDNRVGTQ
jgi:Ca2+-binding EF-hand superfamily protein